MKNNKFILIGLFSSLATHTFLHSAAASIDKNQQLFEAAKSGDLALIKSALDSGAEVNAKNSDQDTPLHLAAEKGHTDAVNALSKAGANVNAQTSIKNTPLHFAAAYGRTNAVDALLKAGADLNLRNSNNEDILAFVNNGYMHQDKKDEMRKAISKYCKLMLEKIPEFILDQHDILHLPLPLAKIIAQYCYQINEINQNNQNNKVNIHDKQ